MQTLCKDAEDCYPHRGTIIMPPTFSQAEMNA